MKLKIFLTLLLMIGLSKSVFAQSQKNIKIVDCNLVRVDEENREFSLVFEIECAYTGVLDSQLAFMIIPLDKDDTVILDANDQPFMSGDVFQMVENTGQGVVDVSVPLSYFVQNSKDYHYACMIFDAETEDTMADSGPLVISDKEIKNLMKQKALNQALDIFDFITGGSGSSVSSERKKNDDGKVECNSCNGSGKCYTCSGTGIAYDEKCWNCYGSGECTNCRGRGYNYSHDFF